MLQRQAIQGSYFVAFVVGLVPAMIIGLLIAVVLLLGSLLPAHAAPQSNFHPVQVITIDGQKFTVGWVPAYGVPALRILDHRGVNVAPTYRITPDDGIFPLLEGCWTVTSSGQIMLWTSESVPFTKYGDYVRADWIGWNLTTRRFVWVRQDWSDGWLKSLDVTTVLAAFAVETPFQRAIKTANRALLLAREHRFAELDQLHTDNNLAADTRRFLDHHPLMEQTVDWRRASHHSSFIFFFPWGKGLQIQVEKSGRRIYGIDSGRQE